MYSALSMIALSKFVFSLREWLVASYTQEEFGITNSVDINWMNTRLSPMPWHTHDQPIRITNPQAKRLLKITSLALNSRFSI
jgi:hypothetical protein